MIVNENFYYDLPFHMFEIDQRADQYISNGRDVIKLAIGIPEFPVPEHVIRAYQQALQDQKLMHRVCPTGLPELKQAIANQIRGVREDDILIHNGTSAIHQLLYAIISRENNRILIPRPWYPLYMMSAYLAKADVINYNVSLETGVFDKNALVEKIEESCPSLVVINSPGNPLGNIIPFDDIAYILNRFESENLYVLIDEVYCRLSRESSSQSFKNEFQNFNNLIVTDSFSKAKSMYTLRIGYGLIPRRLQAEVAIAMRHTSLTVNPAVQVAAISAVNEVEPTRTMEQTYRGRCQSLVKKLENIIPIYGNPTGGMYAFINCSEILRKLNMDSSIELCLLILESIDVAVTPGEDFGIKNGIRISFANSRFGEAVERLARFFSDILYASSFESKLKVKV